MGPAVPYAIGAKWAHPDRPSIAFSGDGAMQMNGLAELITISRYWQQWADPRLIIAILHNNDLNQVTWEMRAMEGAPKFTESQTCPDVDYAAFARSVGLDRHQHRHRRRPRLGLGARAGGRPAHRPGRALRPRTSRRYRRTPRSSRRRQPPSALLHGDEDTWGVVKEGVKQKVQQYLPGEKEQS